MSKGSSGVVVWIFDTYGKSLEIKNYFTKYLKESCTYRSDKYFSSEYFPKYAYDGIIYQDCQAAFLCKH